MKAERNVTSTEKKVSKPCNEIMKEKRGPQIFEDLSKLLISRILQYKKVEANDEKKLNDFCQEREAVCCRTLSLKHHTYKKSMKIRHKNVYRKCNSG